MVRDKIFAVLSGDIVGGSRLPVPRPDFGAALAEGFAALNLAFDGAFRPGLDILAEDRWQMLCTRPEVALRAALLFRAELRARLGAHGVDTRVAIGAGTLDLPPAQRVPQGAGAAYRRSARALECMPRTRRLALRLEDRPLGAGFEEMLGLVDQVASRWTDKQALAVAGALQGWTQERIASQWGRLAEKAVSQQTVAQHLQRAGWHAMAPALEFLEGLLV
jgi:hypothetical protein